MSRILLRTRENGGRGVERGRLGGRGACKYQDERQRRWIKWSGREDMPVSKMSKASKASERAASDTLNDQLDRLL